MLHLQVESAYMNKKLGEKLIVRSTGLATPVLDGDRAVGAGGKRDPDYKGDSGSNVEYDPSIALYPWLVASSVWGSLRCRCSPRTPAM
jgi:hypothetical protein